MAELGFLPLSGGISLIPEKVFELEWLTQLIAQLNGSDLPWDRRRDETDIEANQAGIGLAPAGKQGCYNGCLDAYDKAVAEACCETNVKLNADDKDCCHPDEN